MRRDRVKFLTMALMVLAAGVLPLLSMTQFLEVVGGVVLGYGLYRFGAFLYDLMEVYVAFRHFEARIDAIARGCWKARKRMRLVR